jgi:hypothetical protein
MGTRGIHLGVGVAILSHLLGCRQLVGITDDPPVGDSGLAEAELDATAEGVAYTPEVCQACIQSSCSAQAEACSKSSPCSALEDCLGTCSGRPACRAQCLQSHHVGSDRATPLFESCVARACATPCELTCGGAAEIATPDAAMACQSCFVGQGCSSVEACMADPVCAELAFCALEAVTPAELNGCMPPDAHDGGVDASALTAASWLCANTCDYYSNWSCVGNVTWPAPATGDLTILLTLQDGATLNSSGGGITTKVCHSSDLACEQPAAIGVTAADGTVKLVQHADAAPIVSEGYIELTGGDIVPEIVFWSFPLGQSPARLFALTATEAELTSIVTSLGVRQQASNGVVLVVGRDCRQVPGAGMKFTIAPAGSSKIFYFDGLSFTPDLAATTVNGDGAALITNAPAESVTLTTTVDGEGSIGELPLFVRAGWNTEVYALPAP